MDEQERELLALCYPSASWTHTQAPALRNEKARTYVVYAGRHRYYASFPSWRVFQEQYELADARLTRHYYELIPEGRPCRLYFDFECDDWRWLQPRATQQLFESVFQQLESFLKTAFPLVFDGARYDPRRMLYSTACNEAKFSMHAVGHYQCASNEHLRQPVKNMNELLLGQLHREYPLLVFKNSKGVHKTVIDSGVYTKNRVFRMLHSTKHNSSRYLLPVRGEAPFRDYLISYLDGREQPLALPTLSHVRNARRRGERRTFTSTEIVSSSQPEPGTVESTELKELLQRLQKLVPAATWYRNANLESGTLGFFLNGSACVFGHTHHSNNGFVTYNVDTRAALAYCHSSNCPNSGVSLEIAEMEDLNLFEIEGRHVTLPHLCPVQNNESQSYEPEEWLQELWQQSDVLMIKSPTGTGKTTFCKWVRSRYPDDAVITSIGVRRSFCDNTSPLLCMDNYRAIDSYTLNRSAQTVVQLDSLMRNDLPDSVRIRDLLILDEETAKLSHYFGQTMISRQRRVWERELDIRRMSRKVLVLCADLDQRALLLAERVWGGRTVNVLINDYVPPPDQSFRVFFYESRGMWQMKMQRCLETGENVAFASGSKAEVRRLFREYEGLYPSQFMTSDQPDRVREEHCGNSQSFADYQWVGYTSTMTVGVDINIDHFDTEFGYAIPGSCCAREFMQMLARVRQLRTREIHIYCAQQHPGCIDSVPSQQYVRDLILQRLPVEGDPGFQAALERCQMQLDNCNLLKVKEDFLEQSVFYCWELLRSRTDMGSELKRICRSKGFQVRRVQADPGAEQVSKVDIVSTEIESIDEFCDTVAASTPMINGETGMLARVPETVEEVYSEQKLEVSNRLQKPVAEVLPLDVECWGRDSLRDEGSANVNLLFSLSQKNAAFDEGDSVSPYVLAQAIRAAQDAPSFCWTTPTVVRTRKAKLLYTLFSHLLEIPFFLLNDGSTSVPKSFVKNKLQQIPESLSESLGLEVQLLFELPKRLNLTNPGACIKQLNDCLESFCDIRIKNERRRVRGAGREYFYSVERTMRDRWLDYFLKQPSAAQFDVTEATQTSGHVSLWSGEADHVVDQAQGYEREWPDPFISRRKKRKVEKLERLFAAASAGHF